MALPQLYTEGKYIKRSDSNQPVQLKGLTSNAFRYPWDQLGYKSADDVIKKLNTVKQWGGNSVNLYVDPNQVKDKMDSLDKVVNWANKNNLYVSLYPTHTADKSGYVPTDSKEFQNFPTSLAQRYKNNKNVMYGLWAEPTGEMNDTWVPTASKMVNSLRKVNPDAPVIMSGQYNSRDLDYLQTHPMSQKNLIYDFHDYPYANAGEQSNTEYNTTKSQWMKDQYPVLQGEFGKFWGGDFGSQEDRNYMRDVLKKVQDNGQHSFGYALDEPGGLGLLNAKGIPTEKGQLFKSDMIIRPPTDFSKPVKSTRQVVLGASTGPNQPPQWADMVAKGAQIAKEYNINPAVLVGQMALETGRQVGPGNNMFGIKGSGNAGSNSLATKEQGANGLYSTTGNFAGYKNPEDSMRAYADLITKNPRYAEALQYTNDPVKQLTAIKNAGYATDNNYIQKVMSTPEFQQLAGGVMGAAQQIPQAMQQMGQQVGQQTDGAMQWAGNQAKQYIEQAQTARALNPLTAMKDRVGNALLKRGLLNSRGMDPQIFRRMTPQQQFDTMSPLMALTTAPMSTQDMLPDTIAQAQGGGTIGEMQNALESSSGYPLMEQFNKLTKTANSPQQVQQLKQLGQMMLQNPNYKIYWDAISGLLPRL